MAIEDESVTPIELPPIVETPEWEEHLPALVSGVKVLGGETGEGPANFHARVLDKRTRYLKQEIERLTLQGLNVVGALNSMAELDAIPTKEMRSGTAYFVEGQLLVWNTLEWINSGSLLGPRGITLLGTWPDSNELPAPVSNSVGDAYIWKGDIWLLIPKPDGWVSIGLKGPQGDDAYKVAVNNGFEGTQPEWLATLIGKSAYQVWLDAGNKGAQSVFLKSLEGKDAYQIWLADGHEGSVTDFFESLRGEAGLVWKGVWSENTPYKIFEAVSHLGASYISTQTGANTGKEPGEGVAGWGVLSSKGAQGDPATPFAVMGTKPSIGDLPRPGKATEAWYVGSVLYIWVTDTEDYVDLDGIGGLSAYELALENGFVGTLQKWLASLVGASAYEVWVSEGNVGDKQAYLLSLKGKSSYQSWLDSGGKGTEADFVASLKSVEPGPKGPEGPAKAAFYVMGSKATVGLLPTPGKAEEAWYVGKNLYVWVAAEEQYADLGSMGGMSAYEEAVASGNFVGTLQAWLESLKSVEPGPKGDPGGNLVVRGTVADEAALNTISNPKENYAYVVRDTNHLFSYIDGAWVDLGLFNGKDGKDGKSAYQIWLDNDHSGSELEFLASLKGKDGQDGKSIVVKGSVATYEELPADPKDQDVYAVLDVNTLYCRVGNAWISLGEFKGKDGKNGLNGSSIDIVKILNDDDQVEPSATDNPGKAYINLAKRIMISLNSVWNDAGPVGVPGDRGPQGTGIKLKGVVATASSLPDKAETDEGVGYFTSVDKMLYVLTDGEWAGPFDITGLKGEKGEQGIQGLTGKSINILGHYDTLAALKLAQPTGNLGDGYLVGDNLGIWTTANGGEWIDIGLVRGPEGKQGERGPIGIGRPGDKGEKGSSWITLPAGQDAPAAGFTGNIGDWAVSDTFKVYYKTATSGWQYWSRLVAGDVNSPQLSVGKVVRLGNEWVALPVDEAPAMIEDTLYVRRLIKDNLKNKGEWVPLEFPEPFGESPSDGKLYVRKTDTGSPKGAWVLMGDFITEAPNDGKLYGRKKAAGGTPGNWELIPKSIADLTLKDGKLFARTYLAGGVEPVWQEIIIPADLVSKDGKQYVRVFESNGSAPIWKEIVAPVFDRYTVKLVAATGELDLSLAGAFSINASVSRTLTFKAGTVPAADRSMVVVLYINGAGTIVWPATIQWHGSTQPVLGSVSTVVTLAWDGIGNGSGGRWLGSQGATI